MAHSIALETSLREISDGLRSARMTERKKNGEKLKDFLTMNAVPSLLTENTLKRRGYSWNDLFGDINDYILKKICTKQKIEKYNSDIYENSLNDGLVLLIFGYFAYWMHDIFGDHTLNEKRTRETEKYEISKTFGNVTAPLCTTLLQLCVAGSNKGKAFVKCEMITEACLLVLKDSRLKRAIGDAYLNLLYKHVLQQEHYLGFITPTTWEELLDVCLSACISNYSRLDEFAKLRLVFLVMKNAKNYCQFIIPLRDALPKWKKCFHKVAHDKKAQEMVVEINILLLETLPSECRISLCHFMEGILTPILKFYEPNMDQKKKSSLFQLLYKNVSLHHPLGRHQSEEGSLADDWDIWNKQLHNILELVCLEINVLQKIRKPNDDLLKQYSNFYHLSAAVYFQAFALSESAENEVESATKRQKLSFNKNKTFNDLIDELNQNWIPWLGIIQMYVKNNGPLISFEEYLSLMKVIQLLVNSNNIISSDILEELTCSVLQNIATHKNRRKDECEAVIISLWNSCIRNSTTINTTHKAVHNIMQCLLTLDFLNYQNANSVFKFYTERGMTVTRDSVMTLCKLFYKFFSKYSYDDIRSKCFLWLVQGDITSVDVTSMKELLLRLLSNENIDFPKGVEASTQNNLYDTLFSSNEKCILFSEFELELNSNQTDQHSIKVVFEVSTEIEKQMCDYFKEKMIVYASLVQAKDITLIEYTRFINIVIIYLDIGLKCNVYKEEHVEEFELFRLLQKSLAYIYLSVENSCLNSDEQTSFKIKVLEPLKDILLTDMGSVMSNMVRSCVHKKFFQSINKILTVEIIADDEDVVYAGDEKEMNMTCLKHNCTLVIAAYCRQDAEYREYLLKHILDPKMYDFAIDTPCLFQCIELLNDVNVHEPPSELLFTLMQYMVRDLYRDPEASCVLLENLMKMLETVWSTQGQMKQNCHIMMRSYVTRCQKLHYPPNVAALIYKCVARTAMLNRKYNFDVDDAFEIALTGKIKGDIHSLRIYCCYLLKLYIKDCREDDTEFLLSELEDIFKINVLEGQQLFLKDESTNRTLTVLHCYLALAQTKKALIHQLITAILKLQKDKCLDKPLVKKVLKKIANAAGITNFENYVNKNIVSILYFWFTKNNSVDELPVHLLECHNLDEFKEKYKKWFISADILWRKEGDVSKHTNDNKSAQLVVNLIETCFSEIIVLCLPYMVTEKYALSYQGSEQPSEFKKSMASAQKLFNMTGQILENMKWTDLFVENVGELVLMTALQLWDRKEAMQMFDVKIPEKTKPYGYTKNVFSSILEYFGDLTGGNIMQYLCENQPLAIFMVLFNLWKIVLEENVIEFKVMALHAFITFFEIIPLGLPSDAFVCNFTCRSFSNSIKNCRNPEELQVFTKGAKTFLEKLLPGKVEVVRQSVIQLLSVLIIKNAEGLEKECGALFKYLTDDMKYYLKTSGEDVGDFVNALSQSDRVYSFETMAAFKSNIKQQINNLKSPSPESLSSLHKVLNANKHYVKMLCWEMSTKRFSEDCGSSTVHQLVYAISNILKSVYYGDKIKIEACNCFSKIGTYDLKTLVTVPPADTQKVVDIAPKHYMACIVLKTLSQMMFDDAPIVTSKVVETLSNLLKYQEGNHALELETVDKQILKPLTCSNSHATVEVTINNTKFDQYMESSDGIFIKAFISHWNPNDSKNHGKWLKDVTTVLLRLVDSQSSYFDDLLEVCAIKSSICQKVLPALVGLLLHCSTEKHIEAISEQINTFFNYIWEQTFNDQVESNGDSSQINPRMANALDVGQKIVIQYMLDIVDFVRLQRRYYKSRPDRIVESLNYLRLEYDKVAWAATVADQNLAAIYYGELWAVARNQGVPPSAPEATTNLPGGANIQQIFRKCYVSIGEMDAIDGCGTAHLTIESEKRKHLINTGQYADSLLLHDIALSCGGQTDHDLHCGAIRSLHKSGMHHLALQYIKSLPENNELNDIKYECLSFLGDWSEIVDTRDLEEKSKLTNCNPHSFIKAFHYACLRDCLNIQITDVDNKLVLPLNRAKLGVSRLCQSLNMENCQSVYKIVAKLHLFTDIEEYFSVRMSKVSLGELLSKWEVDNLPIFNDFKHLEALISQRVLILEHAAKTYSSLQNEIVSLQIQYAKLGLSNNRVQMSQRLLAVVKKLQSSEEGALVESEISWAKGHKEIALSLLRNIVTNYSKDANLTARSLRQYGLWMAESKRDNARDIIHKYLLKSLDVVAKTNHIETRLKVYYDLAKFSDAEYKQVVAYMNSSVFETKVKCMENMRGTASSLKLTQHSLTSHERKAYFTNERFKDLDEVEIANTRAEKESFLRLAMRYYLLSLKECEENNLSVFRVISLWVNNPSFEFDDSDECTFASLLHAIPSRKFITVLPQLAPRLTTEDNAYTENLRKIITRCAMEHPHHTLPILFGLKNSEKDKLITNAAGRLGSTPRCTPKSAPNQQELRTIAAEEMVKQLATESRQMALIVAQMELICDATISFANFKPRSKDSKQKIPAAEQITKLKNLDAIPIPTVTISISKDCKYTSFPSLNAFEYYFELVGGINCPKKVFCNDSSGNKRILLIKGEDDMRQDAVMQQVFNIVNTLLEKNPVTSRNKLLIRTYKVVPMSKQSGVLEWCAGTIPVGTYLAGTQLSVGAHSRYRPQDITCSAARKKLQDCHEARKSNKEKLQVFLKILREFKPVFHYFFTEHFLDPVTWYERRLAYMKSVATSSMVGYIIGLGDRHVQNILIDKRTAEVIHIDFGIAFDQGKTLHTPETVPFRLTQDVIAGFGSSGVEGIFRGCCEKTMQLLRDNSETLLTILEVLLCDPLCSWTVTTAQQNANRNISVQGTSGGNSGLAERALLAVSSKLSGTEGGAAGGVAVPGQVARLLSAAADPANLCRLFPGWQPYL